MLVYWKSVLNDCETVVEFYLGKICKTKLFFGFLNAVEPSDNFLFFFFLLLYQFWRRPYITQASQFGCSRRQCPFVRPFVVDLLSFSDNSKNPGLPLIVYRYVRQINQYNCLSFLLFFFFGKFIQEKLKDQKFSCFRFFPYLPNINFHCFVDSKKRKENSRRKKIAFSLCKC